MASNVVLIIMKLAQLDITDRIPRSALFCQMRLRSYLVKVRVDLTTNDMSPDSYGVPRYSAKLTHYSPIPYYFPCFLTSVCR